MASARDPLDTAEPASASNGDPAPRHPVPVGIDAPIFEVMASMRAMRRLRPDPVPEELLRQVIEAASWAPSANHFQRLLVRRRDGPRPDGTPRRDLASGRPFLREDVC